MLVGGSTRTFPQKMVEGVFVPFLYLGGFVQCPDGAHQFGDGKLVLVCYSKDVLKNTFGSYDLMANMVDPLRRAQYDNPSPDNPWNIAPNVSQLRNLALAELGESYPQPFLVPGKKPKNPSPGLLKTLISNKRFLNQTYVGMEGAFAVKVSK